MKPAVPNDILERGIRKYEAGLREPRRPVQPVPIPRVVTISRLCGAKAKAVGQAVADRFGWHLWDKDILDMLASESHGRYRTRMFEALDESTQGAITAFVASLMGNPDETTYLYFLSKAINMIAQHDAIILGRGADLLLPMAFHVHIKASFETRVSNATMTWHLADCEARKKIAAVDRQRTRFRKHLARSIGRAASHGTLGFDLEISTDHLSISAAADTIGCALNSFFAIEREG